jgi:hypothetical protein
VLNCNQTTSSNLVSPPQFDGTVARVNVSDPQAAARVADQLIGCLYAEYDSVEGVYPRGWSNILASNDLNSVDAFLDKYFPQPGLFYADAWRRVNEINQTEVASRIQTKLYDLIYAGYTEMFLDLIRTDPPTAPATFDEALQAASNIKNSTAYVLILSANPHGWSLGPYG